MIFQSAVVMWRPPSVLLATLKIQVRVKGSATEGGASSRSAWTSKPGMAAMIVQAKAAQSRSGHAGVGYVGCPSPTLIDRSWRAASRISKTSSMSFAPRASRSRPPSSRSIRRRPPGRPSSTCRGSLPSSRPTCPRAAEGGDRRRQGARRLQGTQAEDPSGRGPAAARRGKAQPCGDRAAPRHRTVVGLRVSDFDRMNFINAAASAPQAPCKPDPVSTKPAAGRK